jgi:hypothetical protein
MKEFYRLPNKQVIYKESRYLMIQCIQNSDTKAVYKDRKHAGVTSWEVGLNWNCLERATKKHSDVRKNILPPDSTDIFQSRNCHLIHSYVTHSTENSLILS